MRPFSEDFFPHLWTHRLGLGRGLWSDCQQGQGSLGMMRMFWKYIEVVVARHRENAKCRWIVHFKMVNFMLYEFHLSFKNRRLIGIPLDGSTNVGKLAPRWGVPSFRRRLQGPCIQVFSRFLLMAHGCSLLITTPPTQREFPLSIPIEVNSPLIF